MKKYFYYKRKFKVGIHRFKLKNDYEMTIFDLMPFSATYATISDAALG